MVWPSLDKAAALKKLWLDLAVNRNWPDSARTIRRISLPDGNSQTRMVRSSPTVITLLPSGRKVANPTWRS